VITLVMLASALCAAGFGFSAPLSYGFVAVLALIYAAVVQLDSAALTAGTFDAAAPGQRGATLAVHGLIGFGCAGISPLILGMALDATGGGETPLMGSRVRLYRPRQLAWPAGAQARPAHIGEYS
jgi:hypothetical protein